jgi:hypothetical protein
MILDNENTEKLLPPATTNLPLHGGSHACQHAGIRCGCAGYDYFKSNSGERTSTVKAVSHQSLTRPRADLDGKAPAGHETSSTLRLMKLVSSAPVSMF